MESNNLIKFTHKQIIIDISLTLDNILNALISKIYLVYLYIPLNKSEKVRL